MGIVSVLLDLLLCRYWYRQTHRFRQSAIFVVPVHGNIVKEASSTSILLHLVLVPYCVSCHHVCTLNARPIPKPQYSQLASQLIIVLGCLLTPFLFFLPCTLPLQSAITTMPASYSPICLRTPHFPIDIHRQPPVSLYVILSPLNAACLDLPFDHFLSYLSTLLLDCSLFTVCVPEASPSPYP
jgi:hypothetical protein